MTKSSNVVPIRPDADYMKTQAFKDRWAEDYPHYQGQPPQSKKALQEEIQDRLWGEKAHSYRPTPRRKDKESPDLMVEAIKAWRRATLLTWVVMWGWWR